MGMMIPSIYTLRHPLDEIRPCRILPSGGMDIRVENDNDGGGSNMRMGSVDNNGNRTKKQSHPTTNTSTTTKTPIPTPTVHFADVYEEVIFVEKPRSVLPSNNTTTDEGDAIVVTYNV